MSHETQQVVERHTWRVRVVGRIGRHVLVDETREMKCTQCGKTPHEAATRASVQVCGGVR